MGEFNCTLTPLYLVGAPSVYLTARRVEIAFCTVNNNENSNHARCKLAGVLAVTNHCTLDPFDVFCGPYATEYQLQRAARVDTCDGTPDERAGVLCENAKPTVCDPRVSSSATPFANICGTEYVNQQTTLIDACDGDSTRMVDACNAIVSGSVDVKGCIADPFQAVCPATPFTNQRDAICESTATSFTAGCLTSNDYTSSVALGAIGAREDLIENCSDSDPNNDDGCTTVIANSVTVASCIANPFQTECQTKKPSDCGRRDTRPDCRGLGLLDRAFAEFRAPTCLTPATSFTAGCSENEFKGTNTARAEFCAGTPADGNCTGTNAPGSGGSKTYADCSTHAAGDPYQTGCADAAFDNQRTARALACAESATGTGCTTIASGGLTVAGCNATPFAAGCVDNDAFIYARFKSCQDASPKPAHCSIAVADALGSANYVLGDDLQMSATAAETGGLTLADLDENGDTTAGFAFAYFAPTQTNGFNNFGTDKFYAGLLSTTNVGAALTTAPSSGKWAGKLSIATSNFVVENVDFTLDVDFATKTLDAFSTRTATNTDLDYVVIEDVRLTINGKFTDQGIIYGRTDITDGSIRGAAVARGTLTGLIGAKGAVGAFVSSGEGESINTYGEFAGGFVATNPDYRKAPFVPTPDDNANLVSYTDWVRGQELSNQERLSFTANTETLQNEFLAIRTGDDALDEAGLATTTTTRRYSIDLTSIGRTVDGTGGFSIFTHGGFAYAGILPNTDLGAPLTSKDVETTWRGAFYAVGGYEIDQNGHDRDVNGPFFRPADFLLEITFGGDDFGAIKGSFEISPNATASQARGNVYFLLEGTFNTSGYITGTVNFGKFDNGNLDTPAGGRAPNGVLTGIIGQEGAVGAFISNPVPDNEPSTGDRNFIYSGGFAVARDPKPNYATFREFYTPRSDTRELHATHPAIADAGRFIEGTPTGLVTDNFDLGGNGYGPVVVRLGDVTSEHADYTSGFAVMRSNDNKYRAGLLSGTDLGAPLESDVEASWTGKAHIIRHRDNATTESTDLELTVNFADGEINTTTGAGFTSGGSLTVAGRFGSVHGLPSGILGGTVNIDASTGPLAGLIGEKGVLGIFHGVSQRFAGGFWAKPVEAEVVVTYGDDVLYSAWESSFASGELQNSGVASAGLGSFNAHYIKLNTSGNIVVTGGTPVVTKFLRLSDTVADDGYNSGVAYGFGGQFQSYAGLLSTTNVGGAIIEPITDAIWTGRLAGVTGFSSATVFSSNDFELKVNFNAGTKQGTIRTFNSFGDGPAFGVTNAPNTGQFNVNGNFNAAGVISGDVGFGGGTNGSVSGLIGAKGAVAAFKGSTGNGESFAGGFVVSNPGAPSN